MSSVTGLGWKRQRQIVDQYSWNDGRTMPPSGIPISSVQQGFVWTSTYGSDLDALTFPSDDASVAPYPFYDRWADTVNVTTEFVVTDQARGLGTVAFLAAMTPLKTQAWSPPAGQITGVGAQIGQNNGVTVTFQAPGLDLTDARILWEAPGQEPAFGTNYILTGGTDGAQWVEAEAQWPDGRRVFASTRFAVTNGLPNVSISSSHPTMTQGVASDTANFILTRDGGLDAPLTVMLQTSGTATAWNDYRRLQGDMPDGYTIPAGQSSFTVNVYAPGNSTMQSAETAILTVLPGANYNVGTPAAVNLTIQPASSPIPYTATSGVVGLVIQKAASGGITVSWPSTPGQTYSLAAANDLRAPVWTNVATNVTATGSTASWTDASAASVPQRFYKVTSVD
jgi:hypothetical protein